MAEITLTAKTPLNGLDQSMSNIQLREVTDMALVSVSVPSGNDLEFALALESHFGLSMPETGSSACAPSVRAVRSAPDQIFLFLNDADAVDSDDRLKKLREIGYVTIQTDAWVICEISGDGVLNALERICPIDLHDTTFPIGAYARTTMEHLGVGIIRTAQSTFLLMSASSSAASFSAAVIHSISYSSPHTI